MKFWIVAILSFCNLAFADVHIRNGKMTANVMNQPLDKVLEILRKQTNIQFYIDEEVVDESICADFQNLSIGLGIKKLLEGTGINYAVIANSGKTKAIFIGSSQKPQASYKKLDSGSPLPRAKQTTYKGSKIWQPPRPAKNTGPEPKNKKPANLSNPVISIPTAGDLMNSSTVQPLAPNSITKPQGKRKEQ